jgi:hypothetical protein
MYETKILSKNISWWIDGFRILCFQEYLFCSKEFGSVCSILFTLFAYSGIQHILRCVFDLFVFVFCTICCQFLWIVNLLLPLRYSLTFIVWNC